MRTFLAGFGVVLMGMASVASAGEVSIRFEARGHGSTVPYADIANGFILDIYLEADGPMRAAGISIDGDSGFAYAGTSDYWGAIINYADVVPDNTLPSSTAGWSLASGIRLDAGNLPLTGGAENELGSVAADLTSGAGNGLFAWLEFTGLPGEGTYEIAPGAGCYVGDLNDQRMNIVTTTPLVISSGGGGAGGGGGGGGAGGGSSTNGEDNGTTGGDDGADTPPDGGGSEGDDNNTPTGNDENTPGENGGSGNGTIIAPPGSGGDQQTDSPGGGAIAPPICGAGAVEAIMIASVALFLTRPRRSPRTRP